LLSTIDVIAKEEIIGLWWEAAILEQTEQIVVLTMDITTNLLFKGGTVRKEPIYEREWFHRI